MIIILNIKTQPPARTNLPPLMVVPPQGGTGYNGRPPLSPMRPLLHLRLPDNSLAELGHGDLIGRVWSAALQIDDPRISEAHAIISLRGGEFWMLALRRMVAVDQKPVSEVRLVPGLRVELADGLGLVVEEVFLPREVLAIEGDGLPRLILPALCSLRVQPRVQLSPRYEPDAPCQIWSSGPEWKMRLYTGDRTAVDRTIDAGATWEIDGRRFTVCSVPLQGSGPLATRIQGGTHRPLKIIAAFDTVQIHRDDEPVVVLNGISARLISELVALGGPTDWSVVAGELWPDQTADVHLRKRWDVALARLRARLREARIRPDLLHADGTGQLELLLRPEDTVEDRT